ncbi:protein Shroom1 isoform X2 [Phyllostomus hastatus]|uniref:protein Shroom1 isoform X2 n=1 Tax=Phyllostomus hastatus TaxID=9423 RepID=UPI001E680530|nr:protein Shroom1 isoform X2 [Phyllostomus hastatus]
MEALGPGRDRASSASSTHSLDLRRLSVRADSAYGSFSAASGGAEPRTPSPGGDLLPYLDWDYVRLVWGGPAPARPAAALHASLQPRPAAAARSGPCSPQVQGAPGALSRQATPLLYALAAEAEAAARAAEPPSPPASRAAYRQRLQGAQRRVLRETSFQRKELRMSLPARLRPVAPARPPTAHSRSASLGHPGGEGEPARSGILVPGTAGRGRLANPKQKWCFSEPGKLDSVGRGAGMTSGYLGGACSSFGQVGPEPQELQHRALTEFEGLQIRWPPRGTGDPETRSLKLDNAYRPARRNQSASGEALGPWGGPGGAVPIIQAVPQGAEPPRPLFQARHPRFPTQKEAATVVCPAAGPQSSPTDGQHRVPETGTASVRLPSLPDDEVFLEEAQPVRTRSPPDSSVRPGFPASVHASDLPCGAGLSQRPNRATVPLEHPFREGPETAGADARWQGVNGCVSVSRPTCCSPTGTANGDIPTTDCIGLLMTDFPAAAESNPLQPFPEDALGPPGDDTQGPRDDEALAWGTGQPGSQLTWPSPRLEELVQELARLDPSLSGTLTSYPSPESPLDLLDGLIPLAEVWAAMRPACGKTGEEAAGTSEPGCIQLLPTSQEETRLENPTTHTVPDQPCGQGLPEPNSSIQAKKVELADLLQKALQNLQAEQEQLQGAAQTWARRRAALEASVGKACAPRDLERFIRFMADLERVLGLLLLLGSRLARVHRALARTGADSDPDEQASLLQRLRLLQQQQEDAGELKEHVARRERALREVLVQALPAGELRAYCALLAGKAAVLAQQRSLDERVRLLQDQLDAVRSSLAHRPSSPRLASLTGTQPPHKPPFPALLI